jgi:TRAP transporter TAXI family solute receptor
VNRLNLIACFTIAPLLTAPAQAQTVSIVTTPTGSFTNSAGAAMAKVVSEKSKIRAIIQAQAQQGVIPVNAGNAEFGMANSFDTTFYVTGTGEYEGQGTQKNVRAVGSLIPYRVALHVRADSDIKAIADLKGKRVSAGFNAQKTIARITEAHLASAGLSYKDVVQVLAPNVNRSAEDFIAGRTDMLFFAIGSAKVKEAAASHGGLRVLPIEDSPEAFARMQKVLPGSYVLEVKPAPGLDGIAQPTKLVAFDMVLSTNVNVPENVVYEVTKALAENKGALASAFGAFNLFQPDKMAKPIKGVEFHPGALRYYREKGLVPKS